MFTEGKEKSKHLRPFNDSSGCLIVQNYGCVMLKSPFMCLNLLMFNIIFFKGERIYLNIADPTGSDSNEFKTSSFVTANICICLVLNLCCLKITELTITIVAKITSVLT